MENIITTRQALQLIKLINVMNIKDSMINTVKSVSKLEKEKKIILRELLKKKKVEDKVDEETVSRLLQDNPEVAKKYVDIESENEEMTLNLILEFVFALSTHEEIFYKTVSDITGNSIDDVKNEDVTVIVKNLIDMFKSPQFMGFFKLVMK